MCEQKENIHLTIELIARGWEDRFQESKNNLDNGHWIRVSANEYAPGVTQHTGKTTVYKNPVYIK